MNTIRLLSEDALDAVVGGAIFQPGQGNFTNPAPKTGDVGTGVTSIGQGAGALLGLGAQGALLAFAAIPVTGFGSTVI